MKWKSILFSVFTMSVMLYSVISANAAMMLEYDNAVHEYTGSIYTLKVDGKNVDTPLEPIIFNDRALVPIREVFEAMGAKVGYDDGDINVSMNGTTVSMSIGDSVVEVNGKKKTIPDGVVPKLIAKKGESAKTMVPVRFISESIGMDVEFDGDNGVINVNSPVGYLESVSYKVSGDKYIEVTAQISGNINEVSDFVLSNPTRVVVDIKNTVMRADEKNMTINAAGVSGIRLGETNGVSRIVVDLNSFDDYKVSTGTNSIKIKIDTNGSAALPSATPSQVPATPTPSATTTPTIVPTQTPVPTVKPTYTLPPNVVAAKGDEKVIVIDAGHGGKDGGAQGVLNGQPIYEKNLTLSIAKKVQKLVEEGGYRVVMTRSGDTYPELEERSSLANAVNAAMFVSIHINSAEASSASGTEVYYSVKNNGTSYGAKSEELAENVLDGMLERMNTRDRGVKTANHVVTRTSNMPAILLEVGFISNAEELAKMCDDNFQNGVAEGIAEGILKTIGDIKLPYIYE